MYFEDSGAGLDPRVSGLSIGLTRLEASTGKKKARPSQQGSQAVRCQVEGCNLDLTGSKEYHKKHKVCDNHSKSTRVVVAGWEKRFCQQCSRFHDLSEFDQKKRSCRRRLSDHNARRRKPAPEMISFTSARSSSSFYDDLHQINFLWNRSPFSYSGSNASNTWERFSEFRALPSKMGVSGGAQRCLPANELSDPFPIIQHDMDRLLPSKSPAIEIVSGGIEATTVASQFNGAPDIRRALSLLSNEACGLATPESSPVVNLVHINNSGVHFPETHFISDGWVTELPLVPNSKKPPFSLCTGTTHHQEIQLLNLVHETGSFDPDHIRLSSE